MEVAKARERWSENLQPWVGAEKWVEMRSVGGGAVGAELLLNFFYSPFLLALF